MHKELRLILYKDNELYFASFMPSNTLKVFNTVDSNENYFLSHNLGFASLYKVTNGGITKIGDYPFCPPFYSPCSEGSDGTKEWLEYAVNLFPSFSTDWSPFLVNNTDKYGKYALDLLLFRGILTSSECVILNTTPTELSNIRDTLSVMNELVE